MSVIGGEAPQLIVKTRFSWGGGPKEIDGGGGESMFCFFISSECQIKASVEIQVAVTQFVLVLVLNELRLEIPRPPLRVWGPAVEGRRPL